MRLMTEPTIKGSPSKLRKRYQKALNARRIERAYALKKTTLDSVPRIIQLEHTTACNLQCIACPHFYQKSRLGYHLDLQIVERLKEILGSVSKIRLNGGGEPFLATNIESALETYAEYGLEISTTTNLTVLNQRILAVIERNFDELCVSCDGATAEVFEGIRRNSDFAVFKKNVEKVRAINPNMRMVMGITVFRQNLEQLPDIIALAADLGFQAVVVGRMIPRPTSMPHTIRDDITRQSSKANYYFQKARDVALEYGISAVIPPDFPVDATALLNNLVDENEEAEFPSVEYQSSMHQDWWSKNSNSRATAKRERRVCDLSSDAVTSARAVDGNCNWLFENIFINANGDVATCCQKPMQSLGNLKNVSSFFEIWNSANYVKLRQEFWDGRIPKHCGGCQFITQESLSRLSLLRPIATDAYKTSLQ